MKKIEIWGLAAILSAIPLKKASANIADILKAGSIGIECSTSNTYFPEIRGDNGSIDAKMISYVPDWRSLPNPGPLNMNGISFRCPIPAENMNYYYSISPEVMLSLCSGKIETSLSQIYDNEIYRKIESNETVNIPLETRLGLGIAKIKGDFSYSAGLGILLDNVSHSKSRTTTFFDLTSGRITTNTEGSGAGYFIEISGRYKFYKNLSLNIGLALKGNSVLTKGTEEFTDFSCSDNNYVIYKEERITLDGAQGSIFVLYEIGRK